MIRVGVTGAFGQFGWHLRCRLFGEKDVAVLTAGRDTFADAGRLTAFAGGCDAIVHLAGVNRGEDAEVEKANPALATQLTDALQAAGAAPHLIYASSTHVTGDSIYGRAKRRAGDILSAWADKSGARYSTFIFPHLFGENGRPFYNSAVSTFCHQIANGEKPSVHGDGQVELIHFGDASIMILRAIRNCECGQIRPEGRKIGIASLADSIGSLAACARAQIVPDLRDPLMLRLYNTYRSYLYPKHFPVDLEVHSDQRGDLTELVKSQNGGQVFFSTTRPGITRGNHFHYDKVERFIVLKGRARISIRRMLSDEREDFDVNGANVQYIDMPTLHTHNITNIGEHELVTVFWAHEIFDAANPDTVFEQV